MRLIKVLKDNEVVVVDYIPRDLSKYCTSVFLLGGTGECVIIGKRENKRGNGLKVPCVFIVKGSNYMLTNIEYMII